MNTRSSIFTILMLAACQAGAADCGPAPAPVAPPVHTAIVPDEPAPAPPGEERLALPTGRAYTPLEGPLQRVIADGDIYYCETLFHDAVGWQSWCWHADTNTRMDCRLTFAGLVCHD